MFVLDINLAFIIVFSEHTRVKKQFWISAGVQLPIKAA